MQNNTDELDLTLTAAEELRYNRQIILAQVDFEGQQKLKNARVLLVGMGGLGCSVAQFLAASGVGTLGIIDFDTVSLSNLSRQILHFDENIDDLKINSAAHSLRQLNPMVNLELFAQKLDQNCADLIKNYDLILDCSDNLDTRNVLNKLCLISQKTLISGAVIRFEGIICAFNYQENSPCYQCFSQFFDTKNLSCVTTGVISPMVGIVANFMALETMKNILDAGEKLINSVLFIDGLNYSFNKMKLKKSKSCNCCNE